MEQELRVCKLDDMSGKVGFDKIYPLYKEDITEQIERWAMVGREYNLHFDGTSEDWERWVEEYARMRYNRDCKSDFIFHLTYRLWVELVMILHIEELLDMRVFEITLDNVGAVLKKGLPEGFKEGYGLLVEEDE